MYIYLQNLNVVFHVQTTSPVLWYWLLEHGGTLDPPHRTGGYRVASTALERRMHRVVDHD